jgi:serine/threonine protein kinase
MTRGVRKWNGWEAIEEQAFDQGGQGRLYRVRDTTGQRSGGFVLKELKNPKRRERFEKEILAVTTLPAHPNVIEVVDHGAFKDPEKPTYVMLEADRSLHRHVEANRLTVDESLFLFSQITAGVQHLHQHHVIHRDLKPDNVLMFGETPKVSDFGLCLIADMQRVTPTEEAVGPRFYMAPELEDGRNVNVTVRADLYSLGKVLYFMLSHGKVFAREKFRDRKWDLSTLLADDRYRLFNRIFQRTVTSEHDRFVNCAELLSAVANVQVEYRKHPRTTLEFKIPGLVTRVDGTPEELAGLSSEEWNKFLALRASKNAPYSQSIVDAAPRAISAETAEGFGKELLRVRGSIERHRLSTLAAQVVAVSEALMILRAEESEDLALLALETGDHRALKALAKNAMSQSPKVLEKIATRLDQLDQDSLESFLTVSLVRSYRATSATLLNLPIENLSKAGTGILIGLLMEEGSDKAIERAATLLRTYSSLEDAGEVLQGLVLRPSPEKIKLLELKGGYSADVQSMLKVLSDLIARAAHGPDHDENVR